MKVLLTSDIHDCHLDWYGVKTDTRLRKWAADICAEHRKEPIDMILMLGDYALDFWFNGGTYVNKGESRTRHFLETYASLIPAGIPVYMIPGNHEQYAPKLWREITGGERYTTAVMGDVMFIMTDSYAGDLGPESDSDGTYIPTDCAYIKEQLGIYSCSKVFICTHGFELHKETAEFRELVKTESRIKCLFQGHYHLSRVADPGPEWGGKKILNTGNYSYTSDEGGPEKSFWGYRLLNISGNEISSEYVQVACDFTYQDQSIHFDKRITDCWKCSE